jgi:hypothetical protein
MSKQSIDASAHMEEAPQSEQVFPVEREYARCLKLDKLAPQMIW